MDRYVRHDRALMLSGGVFCILFLAIVLAAWLLDFSFLDVHGLLFLSSVTIAFLVAKEVYDFSVETDRVQIMAETLANDIITSSEQLFSAVYFNSPVPYVLINESGLITSANRAALRLFGTNEERVRGIEVFSLLETQNPEHRNFLENKFHSGLAVDSEEVIVHVPEKEPVWVLLSLFPFSDRSEQRLGLLTLVDITRQKAIDKAKSEFVSLASHQLRTPITGMRWSAELLLMDQSDTLTDKQREYINRLLESIQRMSTLVNDFLNVSRLELGTLTAKACSVELVPLFDSIIAEQEVRIRDKSLMIERDFDSSLNEIVTDPDLLRMSLTNLFSNAVKYTRPEGTVTLAYERHGDEVIIRVVDDGMGIPIHEQGRIFEKIYRASNAAKEVPDGTGLGLYIVKESISILHGSVTFTSSENQGTTFTIRLPLSI